MRMNAFDLLDFLNYDRNTKQFLSYAERIFLHQQIARLRNNRAIKEFPPVLSYKISETIKDMNRTNWRYVQVRISQDRTIIKVGEE